MEDVLVELYLGSDASPPQCVLSRGGGNSFGSGGETGIGAAAGWGYDPKRHVLRWEISNVPPGSGWNLKGSFGSSFASLPFGFVIVEAKICFFPGRRLDLLELCKFPLHCRRIRSRY